MLKYIHLGVIITASYVPSAVWALPTLAVINVVFAVMFYWLCFGLLAGLRASNINPEIEVAEAWTSRVVQTGATAFLFLQNDPIYMMVAMFSLPWIITNIVTDIFATLVKWEVLEVTDKEE